MGRAVYGTELADPDFSWLLSNFKEMNPSFMAIESALLPIVLIPCESVPQQAAEEAGEEFADFEEGSEEEVAQD